MRHTDTMAEEIHWGLEELSFQRWEFAAHPYDLVWPSLIERAEVDPLGAAVAALEEFGVEVPTEWWEPPMAILIAEAVERARHENYDQFADPMEEIRNDALREVWGMLINRLAACPDILGGWDDDGNFTLYHPDSGSVLFHDPWNRITAGGEWPHQPSLLRRKWAGFRCLIDEKIRMAYAWATRPENREWVERTRAACAGPVGVLP